MKNNPMSVFLITGSIAVLGLATLFYIGAKDDPAPSVTVTCKFTVPQIMLDSGWKVMSPADDPWLNELAKSGKAEREVVDDVTSCTRYEDNKTPVTSLYGLVMWRVR